MPMLVDPSLKYEAYSAVPFPQNYVRSWPTRRTTVAPTWLSTDLRDGNQALVNPMSNETKLELFRLLVKIGFKEIEVAYPAASDAEYDFVRSLIENGEIPDDVTIQVITPARPDLIRRTVSCLAGVKQAIIHLYNATSPIFRTVVFRHSREQTKALTLAGVRTVRELTETVAKEHGGHFRLNYCMETFSQTEPEFAVDLANEVLKEWGKAGPGKDRVTFNLAATVECAPANHYADLVEYFSNYVNDRDNVILSIHPHNDRGTGVAAAELGLLAGGTRVEGCLLGNGERTGNVDLITLALNLYSQGISPNLDFSDLPSVVRTVERCNDMKTPPRYPYAGALVFSAFAGTHQDAIKKGFDAQEKRWCEAEEKGDAKRIWNMPYIPVDPADLGFGYENLIRVSSQSGKAGAAYVVKRGLGLELPREMQVVFYGAVQSLSERLGKEMTMTMVVETFCETFCYERESGDLRVRIRTKEARLLHPSSEPSSPLTECSDEFFDSSDSESQLVRFEGEFIVDDHVYHVQGDGNGALEAIINAMRSHLDIHISIKAHSSHTVNNSPGTSSQIATFVHVNSGLHGGTVSATHWGVGVSLDTTASLTRAIVSAINGSLSSSSSTIPHEFPRPRLVFHRNPSHVRTGDEQRANFKEKTHTMGLSLRTGGLVAKEVPSTSPIIGTARTPVV